MPYIRFNSEADLECHMVDKGIEDMFSFLFRGETVINVENQVHLGGAIVDIVASSRFGDSKFLNIIELKNEPMIEADIYQITGYVSSIKNTIGDKAKIRGILLSEGCEYDKDLFKLINIAPKDIYTFATFHMAPGSPILYEEMYTKPTYEINQNKMSDLLKRMSGEHENENSEEQ